MKEMIKVSMDDHRVIQGSKDETRVLYTDSLDPCIGIALFYSGPQRKVFVAHASSAYIYEERLEEAINKFISGKEAHIKAYPTGGIIRTIDEPDWVNQIKTNRNKAVDLLSTLPPANIEKKWNRFYLGIDAYTGVVVYED